MRMRRWLSIAIGSCTLSACAAATPPRATTPPPTEIVVDEAVVVRASAPSTRPGELPSLPMPLAQSSPAFQRGFALAQALLDAPAASIAPDDSAAYAAWLESDFKPWLQSRARAVTEANAALGESASGAYAERVVGAALVGLVDARVHAQLLAVPAPPEVRGDDKLMRIYQNGIQTGAASWLEQALNSLRDCADHAARATDGAYVPWLDLCQTRMAELQRIQAEAQALADELAQERAAEAAVPAEGAVPAEAAPSGVTAPEATEPR